MEAVANEWRAHPVHAQYSANQGLGQVRNEKGIVLKQKDGWFRVSDSQRKRVSVKYNTFIEQCFAANVAVRAKTREDLYAEEMEATGLWKRHPTYTTYLGNKDGTAYSIWRKGEFRGRKKRQNIVLETYKNGQYGRLNLMQFILGMLEWRHCSNKRSQTQKWRLLQR